MNRVDGSAAFDGCWQSFIEERLNFFYKKFPLWSVPQDAIAGDNMGDQKHV